METSTSSKVTVEYHDPFGVFPLIAGEIAGRLPLHNLNWHSPPRPLRQIKSLHVDFVPDAETKDKSQPTTTQTKNVGSSTSFDIVRAGQDGRNAIAKERRHQIPGLKKSPYLKVYLLRCDDKVGYKESEKKAIRDWIKENIPPESKRENHNACEWLILHIVLPDTIAASEPRWREGSAKDIEELKERPKSKAKWPGKGDRTVFDRLRADFNESGKGSIDRVAQIRIPRADVPPDLLPIPAIGGTLVESPQERENAWNDLVTKFKTLILGPFDRRVRQYEADIAEQESRRALPGWNFCTFFIHKEGLAMALESVGLVEDALAIYDELSLDLDTVARELASGQAGGTATSFATFTNDIKDRIINATRKESNDTNDETPEHERNDAACLFTKSYRERIVRSDISVFDFICYIFLRQKTLILRLANARSARKELGTDSGDGGEDLVLTSEVCWRASSFIHNASRVLRLDLANAPSDQAAYSRHDIENLVCSWTYSVAQYILEDTAVAALLETTKPEELNQPQINGRRPSRSTISLALGANPYPQRTTSLHPDKDAVPPELLRSLAHLNTREGAKSATPPSTSAGLPIKTAGLPGQAELATYRAELISMRRKILEQVASNYGYFTGWTSLKRAESRNNEGDELPQDSVVAGANSKAVDTALLSPNLKGALTSEAAFQKQFESLTDSALRHFLSATQNKSAERLMGDIALLKCQQENYLLAAAYFERIVPLYSADCWDMMENRAVMNYAKCLKHLQRHELYVSTLLDLSAKLVHRDMDDSKPRTRPKSNTTHTLNKQLLDASELWREAVDASAHLDKEMTQPHGALFAELRVHREILHDDNSDGWGIQLQMCHMLDTAIGFDEVKLRLVSIDDSTQDIWLKSIGPIELTAGQNTIKLQTSTISIGSYLVDKIVIGARKISYVQEYNTRPEIIVADVKDTVSPTTKSVKSAATYIYVFPRNESFHADLRRSKDFNMDKMRLLDVVVQAGADNVESMSVKLKPASAGLRVHLVESSANGVQILRKKDASGHISLGALQSGSKAVVTVPYTMEKATREVAIRYEIQYQTMSGTRTFVGRARISNELPLDVDVNDIFHLNAIFSSFTVRTTGRAPTTITGANLLGSPLYVVEEPPYLPLPQVVYQSQPINLAYKLLRKPCSDLNLRKKNAALALCVDYVAIEDLAAECIRQQFNNDLLSSRFGKYGRLLVPLLVERWRRATDLSSLDLAALLQTVDVVNAENVGWQEILPMIPLKHREGLETWLREWHAEHRSVSLGSEAASKDASQRITVSVDMPNVDMVFHAALLLAPELEHQPAFQPPVLALGEPVEATLRLMHSAQWGTRILFPNTPRVKIQGDSEPEETFICAVGADADGWLIGGKRSFHFKPEDNHEGVILQLTLIPLRLGVYSLPLVEIRPSVPADKDRNSSSEPEPSLTCETYYENAAQVVHVVHDRRATQICIVDAPSEITAAPSSRPSTAVAGSTKEVG